MKKELQAKLEQAKKDRDKIEEEVKELERRIAEGGQFKIGDIVVHCGNQKRVILFSQQQGCIAAVDKWGIEMGWTNLKQNYKKTGENIFKGNLLNL